VSLPGTGAQSPDGTRGESRHPCRSRSGRAGQSKRTSGDHAQHLQHRPTRRHRARRPQRSPRARYVAMPLVWCEVDDSIDIAANGLFDVDRPARYAVLLGALLRPFGLSAAYDADLRLAPESGDLRKVMAPGNVADTDHGDANRRHAPNSLHASIASPYCLQTLIATPPSRHRRGSTSFL
jgi:hypothetical protein